jgi:hypothetical protein
MKNKIYAVIQEGYAIFGIGTTQAEAISDAEQWTDKPFNIVPYNQATDGDFFVVECTPELAKAVSRGVITYEIIDGVADAEQ